MLQVRVLFLFLFYPYRIYSREKGRAGPQVLLVIASEITKKTILVAPFILLHFPTPNTVT